MSTEKLKVLVMIDWFDPGFKAGGPIRSCVNFAQYFKNDLQIYILTTDRDLGDTKPYPGIDADTWVDYQDKVKVFYASPGWLSWQSIKRTIQELKPDAVYVNSMYSKFFSIYPVLLKRTGNLNAKLVLAPRGMLKESAVRFKSHKKNIFLKLYKLLGLHRQAHFHCTDETEVSDVRKHFGEVPFTMLANVNGAQPDLQLRNNKEPGIVKMIFIGRIHPIKNLHYLLSVLKDVKQQVRLTVIGSLEDAEYWQQCQQLIADLPGNIKVQYLGELAHHLLSPLVVEHDMFVLPTTGENFGHAIFEALAAGRPVLISDQTPWKSLAKYKAGWDLPLTAPQQFAEVIEKVAAMNNDELGEWCKGAWDYCKCYSDRSGIKEKYLQLFSANRA
jgi:glycosyltransferase involved in cell wall biosynthesis